MQSRLTLRQLLCSFALSWFFAHHALGQNGSITTARSTPRGIISFSEATTSGIGPGKHIDGYVKKYGTVSFIYPVGDQGILQPFVAAADQTTGAYFHENPSFSVTPTGAPFRITSREAGLAAINSTGFWDVDGVHATKLTFTWSSVTGVASLTANTLSRLTIAGWSTVNSRWETIPSVVDPTAVGGGASSLNSGSITTTSAFVPNNYSIYALAQTVSGPLPVTLMNFTVSAYGESRAILNWHTTFESSSHLFDIEHSVTGKSWARKGSVMARGGGYEDVIYEFVDDSPASGVNLYRLRMLDLDSTFTYSKIQSVRLEGTEALSLYPNPTSDRLYFDARTLRHGKSVTFYSTSGRAVYTTAALSVGGMDLQSLSAGAYIVKVILQDGTTSSQRIVVNK
jgi:hypothetical protein